MTKAQERIERALDAGLDAGLLRGVHALMVARGGETVCEIYRPGEDESWAEALGRREFGPDSLHDLRSVSKSVVALAYGILLERGLVPPPEAPLIASFPEHADLAEDPRRARWTVADALDMRLGIRWDEDRPYDDPENSEIAMERSSDRIRYVLERSFVQEPGGGWIYCGGATALIGEIIARGTGKPLDAAVREILLEPLGIAAMDWLGTDKGPSAASGLRLTTPGLLAIGEAVRNCGRQNDRQVIPRAWIETLTRPAVRTPFDFGYRNQWYTARMPAPRRSVDVLMGIGNGGQRLWIVPELEATVALFCGSYNRPDQWVDPLLVLQRIVLPTLDG